MQTRNPLHGAHLDLARRALSRADVDGLLLHPAMGITKEGDLPPEARVRCYEAAMGELPAGKALLAYAPLAMRMAGPREALWHAMVRKGFGAAALIVGRDHAGPGNDAAGKPYYPPYAAQELLAGLDARRFRYSTTANVIADRRNVNERDAVAERLTDGLITRLVAAPVLGPAAVAILFWHQTRTRPLAPVDWSSRTIAHDLPWLVAAPVLVIVIAIVQAVLLHRATSGSIWRTVRAHRGSRLLAVAAVLAAGTFALDLASLVLPFAEARPLLLGAAGGTAALLIGALLVGAVLSRRLQRRGDTSGRAAQRVADWTGVEPSEITSRSNPRILLGAFLTLTVALPLLMLLTTAAVSRMNGPADLDPTTSIALERPWLLPAVLLGVLLIVLAGNQARRAGAPVGRALRQRSSILALTYGCLLTAATVAAAVAPLWTGQRLVLLLLVPHVLAILVGGPVFLIRTHARRQFRRRA